MDVLIADMRREALHMKDVHEPGWHHSMRTQAIANTSLHLNKQDVNAIKFGIYIVRQLYRGSLADHMVFLQPVWADLQGQICASGDAWLHWQASGFAPVLE
jgi:hypothetical protein